MLVMLTILLITFIIIVLGYISYTIYNIISYSDYKFKIYTIVNVVFVILGFISFILIYGYLFYRALAPLAPLAPLVPYVKPIPAKITIDPIERLSPSPLRNRRPYLDTSNFAYNEMEIFQRLGKELIVLEKFITYKLIYRESALKTLNLVQGFIDQGKLKRASDYMTIIRNIFNAEINNSSMLYKQLFEDNRKANVDSLQVLKEIGNELLQSRDHDLGNAIIDLCNALSRYPERILESFDNLIKAMSQ